MDKDGVKDASQDNQASDAMMNANANASRESGIELHHPSSSGHSRPKARVTYGDVRHSAMSANIVSDGFHHTLPSGSFFHEKPLMSPVETEDLSRTWDYLVGHVGIKTLGTIVMKTTIQREQESRKKNDLKDTMQEILFPPPKNWKVDTEEERVRADIEERGRDLILLIDRRVKQARNIYRRQPPNRLPLSRGEYWELDVKMALGGTGFKRVNQGDIPENYPNLFLCTILETIWEGLEANSKWSESMEETWMKFLEYRRPRKSLCPSGRFSMRQSMRQSVRQSVRQTTRQSDPANSFNARPSTLDPSDFTFEEHREHRASSKSLDIAGIHDNLSYASGCFDGRPSADSAFLQQFNTQNLLPIPKPRSSFAKTVEEK